MARNPMKASDLVKSLQALIAEHGDLLVFSYCDHELVQSVDYDKEGGMGNTDSGPAFVLS